MMFFFCIINFVHRLCNEIIELAVRIGAWLRAADGRRSRPQQHRATLRRYQRGGYPVCTISSNNLEYYIQTIYIQISTRGKSPLKTLGLLFLNIKFG